MVLKMGSPGRYCGAQTFNTKENTQVCGKTVLRLQAHNANQKNPKDDLKREASTENSPVKDIRILLRYQHDDKVSESRSFSLCRSSANRLKEALWSCLMHI